MQQYPNMQEITQLTHFEQELKRVGMATAQEEVVMGLVVLEELMGITTHLNIIVLTKGVMVCSLMG